MGNSPVNATIHAITGPNQPMDEWTGRAADVPVVEGGFPNPLETKPPTANVPEITLITKRDTPSLISKRISLDGDGKLKSDGSECLMSSGTATRTLAGRQRLSRRSYGTVVPIRRSLSER